MTIVNDFCKIKQSLFKVLEGKCTYKCLLLETLVILEDWFTIQLIWN